MPCDPCPTNETQRFSDFFYEWVSLKMSNRRSPKTEDRADLANEETESSSSNDSDNNSYDDDGDEDDFPFSYDDDLVDDVDDIDYMYDENPWELGSPKHLRHPSGRCHTLSDSASATSKSKEQLSMNESQAMQSQAAADNMYARVSSYLGNRKGSSTIRANKPSSRVASRDDASAGLLAAFTSTNDREQPVGPTPPLALQKPPAKRAADVGAKGPAPKKYRFTPNVYNLKPRLIVKLKLTREKDPPKRTEPAPAQQTYTSVIPSALRDAVDTPRIKAHSGITDRRAEAQPGIPRPWPSNSSWTPINKEHDGKSEHMSTQASQKKMTPAPVTHKTAEPTQTKSMTITATQDLETIAKIRKKWPDRTRHLSDEHLLASLDKGNLEFLRLEAGQSKEASAVGPTTPRATIGSKPASREGGSTKLDENNKRPNGIHPEHGTKVAASSGSVGGSVHQVTEKDMPPEGTQQQLDSGTTRGAPGEQEPKLNVGTTKEHINDCSHGLATKQTIIGGSSINATNELTNRVTENNLPPAGTQQLDPRTPKNVPGHQDPTSDIEATSKPFDKPSQSLAPKQSTDAEPVICEAETGSTKTSESDLDTILRKIDMRLFVKFEDGRKHLMADVDLERCYGVEDFFQAAEEVFQGELGSDERFTRATVTQAKKLLTDYTEHGMCLQRASRKNKSWTKWLASVQAFYAGNAGNFAMEMEAELIVGKKVDGKKVDGKA